MDESPQGAGGGGPGAPEADVEAAVPGVEGETGQRRADDAPADAPPDLPDGVLNAPTSAEEAGHTLLEDHERETRSPWRNRLRLGAFWAGATTVALAVTLTAIVSLRRSGFSDGLAFVLGSVGMAVVVGFVFLSVRR